MNVLEQNNVGLEFLVLLTVTDGSEECMPSKRGGGGGGSYVPKPLSPFFSSFSLPPNFISRVCCDVARRLRFSLMTNMNWMMDGRDQRNQVDSFSFFYAFYLFFGSWRAEEVKETKDWDSEGIKPVCMLSQVYSVQCTTVYRQCTNNLEKQNK